MIDDENLPDEDYRSVYGPEALEARQRARMAAWIEEMRELNCHQQALIARLKRLDAPSGPAAAK